MIFFLVEYNNNNKMNEAIQLLNTLAAKIIIEVIRESFRSYIKFTFLDYTNAVIAFSHVL